jgi:trigger factor
LQSLNLIVRKIALKIETQPLEDHQVKLTVEVEPDSFESAKRRAARQISRKTKIPGFRPGKAPYQVVVRQIGEATIIEEALELLVTDIYPKIIDEAAIQPYGPGQLENVVSMDPPVLEFLVPLEAEVVLGDYRSISHPYEPKQITEKEVNNVLDDLRDRQAILEPVERPAQENDMVFVRLSGIRKEVEEGEDSNLISERTLNVKIKPQDPDAESEETGSKEDTSTEWPFPGFSRHLIGHSAGDELTLTYTFSQDSDFESLHGVEAEYHVTLEDVKSRTLPELDDEFAATLGEYETIEDLREEIRSGLEQQSLQAYNEEYDTKILDEAIDQATIKYPPQMLEREIDSVIHNLEHRLEEQNLDMDLYLKTRDMDMDALKEEARPVAESRLKRSLFLFELAKAEKIEVEQEELQTETLRTMDSLAHSLSEKDARQLNNREVFSNLVGSIMADMLTQQSIERLRKIASGQLEEEPEVEETKDEVGSATPDELIETEANSPISDAQEVSEESLESPAPAQEDEIQPAAQEENIESSLVNDDVSPQDSQEAEEAD